MNYPDTYKPTQPYEWSELPATLVTEYDSAYTKVRKLRERALYRCRLTYPIDEVAQLDTLRDFLAQIQGRFTAFTFTDFMGHDSSPVGIKWYRLYVGVGTGGAFVADLPFKSLTSETVYVAGSSVPATDYTITAGGGTDGRDKIEFDVGHYPASGAIVTISGTGRRSMRARLANDRQDFQNPALLLTTIGLEIQEDPYA